MIFARAKAWFTANWFVVAAPSLFLAAALVSRSAFTAVEGPVMERALLFDACVTLPALYALCYGRSLSLWQLALRMVGIACLGIYFLGFIVPVEEQRLLPAFAWARTAGMILLIVIELRILIATLGLLFRPDTTAEEVAARSGMPMLTAKLMLLEARMWKRLARFLRGR